MSWLLPLCLISAIVVATYFGLRKVEIITSNAIPHSGQTLTPEELKASLDDLKWILGLIITAAGLFTVAQAANSFFNAQAFTKQAEDSIKRIESLERDLQERFPYFTKIERVRKDAYGNLALIFGEEGFDWRNDLYGTLPSLERQKLLSVEHFVGIEFLQMDNDPQFADNLRRLGNLYASKFRYDLNVGYQTDLERAEYYLLNALERTTEKFRVLNDLGVLYLEFYRINPKLKIEETLSIARSYFDRSVRNFPRQQRAYYNLGVAATYEKNWKEAADQYEKALLYRQWELTHLPNAQCSIYYNMGCAKARLYYEGGKKNQQLLDECLKALESAAAIGLVRPQTVTTDLGANGDLLDLSRDSNEDIVKQFQSMISRLSSGKTSTPDRSMAARIQRALDSLQGKF
jgi:hypothetical protein